MGNAATTLREQIYEAFRNDIKDFDGTTIDALRNDMSHFKPADGTEQEAMRNYDEDFLVRFTYESNSIEGSTLSIAETDLVIEGEFKPSSDTRLQDVFAARGIADGCEFTKRALATSTSVSEAFIKDLHERVALDCQPAVRGTYRLAAAYIRGSRTTPADPLSIRDLMPTLLYSWKASNSHPVAKAAAFHAMFENIHPFQDGNGRTGRLVMNYMLQKSGYPPIAIKHDGALDYKVALEDWQVRNNPETFLSLVTECIASEATARIALVRDARKTREVLSRGTSR